MKHQQIFQLEQEIQRKNKLIKLALIIENYILLCTHFFIRIYISLFFIFSIFFFINKKLHCLIYRKNDKFTINSAHFIYLFYKYNIN
jgi:hypothetical protein